MNTRQQRFVDAYLADPDLNATAAYVKAGYKTAPGKSTENAASRLLLENVGVREAVAAGMKKRSEKTGITQAWVLHRLKLEAEREGPAATHGARVAALGLAAKHLGMLKEDAPHPERQTYDFDRLTTEQRATLLLALRPLFAPRPLGTSGEA